MKYITSTMVALVLVVTGAGPLIASAETTTPASSSVVASDSCIYINNNLSFGARDSRTNGNVVVMQAFLFKYKFLTVEPTGYFGPVTLKAVKAFQAKYNLPQTGFFGPLSRSKMKEVSCNDTNAGQNDVKVSVVTDKTQYAPNDKISITLTATNLTTHDVTYTSTNGCLTSYKIGEYNSLASQACTQAITTFTIPALSSKTWTMTHDLSLTPIGAGTYTVEGSVFGAGVGSTTITIGDKVGSVTVKSPNGGETFKLGTQQTISWNSYFPYPTFAPIQFTIKAMKIYECSSQVCPMIAYSPLVVANGVGGNSYNWTVGKTADGSTLTPGKYVMTVCMSGDQTCDSSDSPITIAQ